HGARGGAREAAEGSSARVRRRERVQRSLWAQATVLGSPPASRSPGARAVGGGLRCAGLARAEGTGEDRAGRARREPPPPWREEASRGEATPGPFGAMAP